MKKKCLTTMVAVLMIVSCMVIPFCSVSAASSTPKIESFAVKSFSIRYEGKGIDALLETTQAKNSSSSYGTEFQYKINDGKWSTFSQGCDGHQKKSQWFSSALNRSTTKVSFRARAYSKVNGKKVYSSYSKVKTYNIIWYRAKWYHPCMSVRATGANISGWTVTGTITNYLR